MKPSLQDATFRQMRDFIYELCGIFIPDTKKYLLENRLYRRLEDRNLKSFEDYFYLLKYGGDPEAIKKLYDSITTNETSFFREPQQLETFMGTVLQKVAENNHKPGKRTLRVWSAACSTGEEPYTLAMMLLETALVKTMAIDIYATDISEAVINSAKRAVYNSYALRNVPELYLGKYFTNSNQSYSLSQMVKGMVKFSNLNLLDDKKMKLMRDMDVLFCRNVLIYFDDKAKQKVVSLLYDSLRPGGYLLIGTSESLHNVTRAFRPIFMNKTLVYQKDSK